MARSYNIVVNSNFCTSATAGNANSNKNYYIDWTAVLPKGSYELTFSFISEATDTINVVNNIPLVYIDFLTQGNINATQTGFQATASQFLGMLYPTLVHPATDSAFLRAEQSSNNPIYLVNRPYSNEFRVQILNNANPPVAWVDDAVVPNPPASYVMNLNFKLLKLEE